MINLVYLNEFNKEYELLRKQGMSETKATQTVCLSMEEAFREAQEDIGNNWNKLWLLFYEAIRICILKKLKGKIKNYQLLDDKTIDGCCEIMSRYKENPNYRVKYLFCSSNFIALKMLNGTKARKEENENAYSYEDLIRILGIEPTDDTSYYEFNSAFIKKYGDKDEQ